MLVLSRRPHEAIRIRHDIVVTVLEISGDKVRLGIEAPGDVQIHREEIYLAVRAANEEATARPGAAGDLARALGSGAPAPAPRGSGSPQAPARPAGPTPAAPGRPAPRPPAGPRDA
ncbi:carbon storage regulator CsrA [Phycicoccus sp. MAQZ13P-2]|uniref:carbon storage regulator CsrA n=1 Tax=Phycicoccus mangrovi TaxID=2840470 RepID=UPI001C007E77|nr:carbon storage regulator CsrA [Phycicoccus mangrovi]MBT9254926.1 carbon storage regulator CsrA [Phycicoccus mangrovi]MBT9256077.1 carbon storage regulator CsrA [Phycicoccus mangrovi]MBT9273910.1 carbon storage regulator CsrA [Phycicoccus mangrovi]